MYQYGSIPSGVDQPSLVHGGHKRRVCCGSWGKGPQPFHLCFRPIMMTSRTAPRVLIRQWINAAQFPRLP